MVAFTAGLCWRCARRGWLLSCLGDALDGLSEDPARLWPALELDDCDLITALTGSDVERSALTEQWKAWSLNYVTAKGGLCDGSSLSWACRHHCRYPACLRDDPSAPHALVVSGDPEEDLWAELGKRKVVAIAGAQSPSEYGVDVARSFAAELAAAGVIVAGSASGVGAAARAAATESGGTALFLAASLNALQGERPEAGQRQLTMVEPVAGAKGRPWTGLAAERTLALIADLVLVVQAHGQSHFDLACAGVARSRGVPVVAVPGPIDSPACRGSNHLLACGARVVCGTGDTLDALFGIGGVAAAAPDASCLAGGHRGVELRRGRTASRSGKGSGYDEARPVLAAAQGAVLDLLGDGKRTLAEIGRALGDEDRAAVAVAELELLGLAIRGDDGRYRAVRFGHLR